MAKGTRRRSGTIGSRIEHDSMGELTVAADALWGAQTERARRNFQLSPLRMPQQFLRALALVKAVAADTNAGLGLLPAATARAIRAAAEEVASGAHPTQFPVDVFQTGSGTSTNMNMNEVLARLASARLKKPVHPNDHVNLGQSSNDVIPTALLVATSLSVEEVLLPALAHLESTIERRARELARVTKTGRTHLMDAVPLTFGQELSGWAAIVRASEERLRDGGKRLRQLPWGGTAVGTGINAHPHFAAKAIAGLAKTTGLAFTAAASPFHGLSHPDAAVELAGHLGNLAGGLLKISNDLRWMNSGPLAGLGEIELPALQPGSSIMPGKVNPVIPEAVAMVAVHVRGSCAAVSEAGASGNFQLNVMLPLLAHSLLESLDLLASAAASLADRAIAGFVVREDVLALALARNPILVTALNPIIGYEHAAAIAKRAYAERRPILDVAAEETRLSRAELEKLLDPRALTNTDDRREARRSSAPSRKTPAPISKGRRRA
ncbi:MAG TPA: class II fumarate hydratase [Polyangiaceae bacterium]|nr:class II fumarate hydratase [Polyangiaceae bacterium]